MQRSDHIAFNQEKKLSKKLESQKSTELLMRRVPFQKLIRKIAQEICSDLHFQAIAIRALQEPTESYMIHLLEDSDFCATHARHVTIMTKDMQLAPKIRGENP